MSWFGFSGDWKRGDAINKSATKNRINNLIAEELTTGASPTQARVISLANNSSKISRSSFGDTDYKGTPFRDLRNHLENKYSVEDANYFFRNAFGSSQFTDDIWGRRGQIAKVQAKTNAAIDNLEEQVSLQATHGNDIVVYGRDGKQMVIPFKMATDLIALRFLTSQEQKE
jgi:CRISPR/Cas system CSM-associated protein Csm3 (group 7 of RAMP superfamily)